MKKIFLLPFIIITFVFQYENNFAIPAFGRKYNMSCQTCHSPFPKLKPYGDEFAGNGFVIADKDAPRYFIDTGDEELSLLREIPLALRLEGYLTYNNQKSERFDFSSPYIIKLLSGGAIASNISYYFYFFLSERGEVAGLEDAFIMFNNLFNQDLDLYIGQFQVSDPLFKRELRLTFEDYQIYTVKPGLTKANLTYERGMMLTYGLPTKTDITIEVLNGTGIGSANNFKIFDDDNYKNFLGRISQDITKDIRLGFFGYYGKEKLSDNLERKFTNTFSMWGPDFSIKLKDKLELNFQYAQRNDEQPLFRVENLKTKGLFWELILTPKGDESKWYSVFLYNWVDSDIDTLDYISGTLSIGYLLKRNIRLITEFTHNFEKKYSQIALGIVSAF
ncbi:MAG: hypothetical protein N2249_04200 [Melioribacter sp.]|nr:hypothetical protein [Melioribacter sp.]